MPQVVTDNLEVEEVRFWSESARSWRENERKKRDPKPGAIVREGRAVLIWSGCQWVRFT